MAHLTLGKPRAPLSNLWVRLGHLKRLA